MMRKRMVLLCICIVMHSVRGNPKTDFFDEARALATYLNNQLDQLAQCQAKLAAHEASSRSFETNQESIIIPEELCSSYTHVLEAKRKHSDEIITSLENGIVLLEDKLDQHYNGCMNAHDIIIERLHDLEEHQTFFQKKCVQCLESFIHTLTGDVYIDCSLSLTMGQGALNNALFLSENELANSLVHNAKIMAHSWDELSCWLDGQGQAFADEMNEAVRTIHNTQNKAYDELIKHAAQHSMEIKSALTSGFAVLKEKVGQLKKGIDASFKDILARKSCCFFDGSVIERLEDLMHEVGLLHISFKKKTLLFKQELASLIRESFFSIDQKIVELHEVLLRQNAVLGQLQTTKLTIKDALTIFTSDAQKSMHESQRRFSAGVEGQNTELINALLRGLSEVARLHAEGFITNEGKVTQLETDVLAALKKMKHTLCASVAKANAQMTAAILRVSEVLESDLFGMVDCIVTAVELRNAELKKCLGALVSNLKLLLRKRFAQHNCLMSQQHGVIREDLSNIETRLNARQNFLLRFSIETYNDFNALVFAAEGRMEAVLRTGFNAVFAILALIIKAQILILRFV